MNFYFMRHTLDEADLCKLEKKCLFHVETEDNFFSIENYIDVDRSPFVKYCIKDYMTADSLEKLVLDIKNLKMSAVRFKVKYLDVDGSVAFDKRHEIEGIIGKAIQGDVNVSAPAIIYGVTRIGKEWMLGEYLKSSAIWLKHKDRPRGYCNALTNRVSRAILNIATGNETGQKIIDPCCGIGTVVIEGLSMGLDMVGSDINRNVVRGARCNLRHFHYPEVIQTENIHDIIGHYDIAVVDLPYGILSITDKELQLGLVRRASEICDKLALLGIEDISEELKNMGLVIIHQCVIAKGNFKRNFYICNTSKILEKQ